VKVGIVLHVDAVDGAWDWQQVRDSALASEAAGLDSVWVPDHFFYKPPEGDPIGMKEAWTVLSAVAGITERVEIAPIVLCGAFRNPGLMANMAATLDAVSGGRLVLGVGAGWHDPEFEAHGFPTDHKVGRFEEWIQILVGLLRDEQTTFDGRWHQARDAAVVPPPTRRIPILIAGNKPRMMRLVARYADVWNTAWFGRPDDRLHERLRDLDAACEAEGRDPASLERTVGLLVRDPDQPSTDEDEGWFDGSVEEVAELLREHEQLGFGHAIVITEPRTPRSVERLAEAARLFRSRG
jgi:alkanesulfonate monooxygenase SsuD/methylene tetrahydromethanopterin reductase-like flavin-dependent oxidoreductase (luciferase family)